jgi:hypothetical protein
MLALGVAAHQGYRLEPCQGQDLLRTTSYRDYHKRNKAQQVANFEICINGTALATAARRRVALQPYRCRALDPCRIVGAKTSHRG